MPKSWKFLHSVVAVWLHVDFKLGRLFAAWLQLNSSCQFHRLSARVTLFDVPSFDDEHEAGVQTSLESQYTPPTYG